MFTRHTSTSSKSIKRTSSVLPSAFEALEDRRMFSVYGIDPTTHALMINGTAGNDQISVTMNNTNKLGKAVNITVADSSGKVIGQTPNSGILVKMFNGKIVIDGNGGSDSISTDTAGADLAVTLKNTTPAGASAQAVSLGGETLNINSGTLTLNSTVKLNALNLNNYAKVTLPAGSHSVLVTKSISLSGSPSIDLNDNAMIVDYDGNGGEVTQQVRDYLVAGRNGTGLNSDWKGNAGIFSSVAAQDPQGHAVGYADNAELPLGSYSTFMGQSVDDSCVLIRYTKLGDANLDGRVNDDDVTVYAASDHTDWAHGDFFYSGNGIGDDSFVQTFFAAEWTD